MALILRRRGIQRVRPLAGGFRAWRDLGYPMTGLVPRSDSEVPSLTPSPAER